jgi:hypothetical protein
LRCLAYLGRARTWDLRKRISLQKTTMLQAHRSWEDVFTVISLEIWTKKLVFDMWFCEDKIFYVIRRVFTFIFSPI